MKNNLPSKQEVLHSKTPKIYKNKKLNDADFNTFNHNDYQVFLHLISKVGGVDEFGKYLQPKQLEREYTLTGTEFSEVFGSDIDNSYKSLRKACKKLMKCSINVQKPELNEVWEINICSTAKYNLNKGSITIRFTDDIMPYLAQVKKKFVLYNLKEVAKFRSLYSIRLYELLQEFKDTGYLIKSVEQLRQAFGTGDSFKRYNDFKRYTFDHACQEINNNYKMNLGYEEIKKGRKVAAIRFVFKRTKIYRVVNQKTGISKNFYMKPEKQNKAVNETPTVKTGKGEKLIKNVMSKILKQIKN